MLGLSRSAYYYTPKIESGEKQFRDAELQDKIETIQAEFPGYGYRRIREHLLLHEGIRVNTKRLRRIMKEEGLFAIVHKAFVRTTDSDHGFFIYPNLIKGKEVTGTNQVWVSDITYIRIKTCFVYLAVILDLFSRKVIGWAISRRIDRHLCLEALRMALEARQPPAGCIHHSDRGVQYACGEYVDLLKQSGLEISMSAKGNPYDNAFAESFFKTLKYEEVHLWDYETLADVIERVPYFIEEVYNKKRLHSSLGYLSPEMFENRVTDQNNNNQTESAPLF